MRVDPVTVAAAAYVDGGDRADLHRSLTAYAIADDASTAASLDELHRALSRLRASTPDHQRLRMVAATTHEQHAAVVDALDAAVHRLARTAGHPVRPLPDAWLDTIALAFAARYDNGGGDADLFAVAGCLRRRSTAPDDATLLYLSGAARLRQHDQRPGDTHDADGIVEVLERALAATPPGHPRVSARVADTAAAHLARFETTGHQSDTDRSTVLLRHALAGLDTLHPAEVCRVARAVLTLVGHVPRDRAADLLQALVVGLGPVASRAPDVRALLATALVVLHPHRSDPRLLDAAVTEAARAVAETGTPSGHLTDTHARCLAVRGASAGDRGDLAAAITIVTRTLDVSNPDDLARRTEMLSHLHRELYTLTDDPADLDRAIDRMDDAIEQAVPGQENRIRCHYHRAGLLMLRSRQRHRPDDLDEAITIYRRGRSRMHVAGLGSALHDRFLLTGSPTDLDEAIGQLRDAVAAGEDATRALLAIALHDRYRLIGDSGDRTEAIDLLRVVHARSSGHPGGWECELLATALAETPEALQQAMDCARASVASWRPGPRRDKAALVLARTLLAATAVDRAHIEEIQVLVTALLERPDLATVARAEALLLTTAVEQARLGLPPTGTADLAALAELAGQARDLLPAGSASRALATSRHAFLVGTHGLMNADLAALRQGITLYEEVAHDPRLSPAMRREAAQAIGRLAMQVTPADLDRAIAGYRLAIDLAADTAAGALPDTDRHLLAGSATDLGTEAAAAAVASGDFDLALRLSERSRFLAWGGALRRQRALAELRRRAPDLAARIDALTRQMDRLTRVRPADAQPRWQERPHEVVESPSELRSRMRRALAAAVGEAGAVLGRDLFSEPATLSEVQHAVSAGTAVLINVSRHRCDALLVDRSGLRVLPLSGLTAHDAQTRAEQYIEATRRYASAQHPTTGPTGRLDMMTAHESMGEVLAWLWEVVAGPVLDALGHRQTAEGRAPRVWWCPTGPLTLLPIHAAERAPGSSDAVLQRVTSSYALTLTHLALAARSDGHRPPGLTVSDRPCFIAVADPPGLPPLAGPDLQLAAIAPLLEPPPVRLDGREVTRDRFLHALVTHRVVHVAAHGHHDLREPLRGGLVVADGSVTFQDIAAHRADVDLAFLDACHTAIGGAGLPDEGVHLASALQLAGARHVIATLWQVVDHDLIPDAGTRSVARAVYERLAPTRTVEAWRAPYALHEALRERRREGARDVSAWAPYLHYGP